MSVSCVFTFNFYFAYGELKVLKSSAHDLLIVCTRSVSRLHTVKASSAHEFFYTYI